MPYKIDKKTSDIYEKLMKRKSGNIVYRVP